MNIEVVIHLESIAEEPGFSWWAETTSAPGFSAAADNLPELRRRTETALRDCFAADGVELDVPLRFRLANDLTGNAGALSSDFGDSMDHGDPFTQVAVLA